MSMLKKVSNKMAYASKPGVPSRYIVRDSQQTPPEAA